jgi:hypothetical protein
MPVIGFLGSVSYDGFTDRLRAFCQSLKDTGYVEGESVTIEYRWAKNLARPAARALADIRYCQPRGVSIAGGCRLMGIDRSVHRRENQPLMSSWIHPETIWLPLTTTDA